jgi:plasmid stability protein
MKAFLIRPVPKRADSFTYFISSVPINMAKQKPKSKGIVSWPETERPREKLFHSGPESLSDRELLAVLVRIGKKGQSAEDLGRQILTKFNGISGIEHAHIEELLSVSGMERGQRGSRLPLTLALFLLG